MTHYLQRDYLQDMIMRDNVKTRAAQLEKFEIVMKVKVYLHSDFFQISQIELAQLEKFGEITMQIHFHFHYN